ncbi:hypothetical protein [Litoribrevibacter albus]|uniref:Uncharacterized protein n=1 Tax=Litoribrevibacter albus TaxID=1473156 RepID=A0AA37SC28_9GAMM|nr:hypothetical protein [Litoribrevibacter albus]GLQ31773.1 hypothetical protein GCM10007876_22520 [Litoribrevibacter albus]
MSNTPAFLQDAKDLLTKDGFATGDVWYHGTSSALLESIQKQGLSRAGDKAMKHVRKSTLATIGDSMAESHEPICLTQSKELAYFWATQTVRDRSVRFEGEEQPLVLEVTLPTEYQDLVKPDTGFAGMLLVDGGGKYMELVQELYKANGVELAEIDPLRADRSVYLNALGLAYIDKNIPPEYITALAE